MFRKYFPYAVVPQVVMLGYAIYLRIAQYELTMNRYFVVIFGFWLIFISLYLIVSRRKSPIMIPLSLSLISLIISVGPWSVFNYPQVRQEARLMRNLTVAGILQNGKIIPLSSKDTISKELSAQINNGVRSLCSFDECKRIKQIFPDQNRIAEQEVLTKWQSEIN